MHFQIQDRVIVKSNVYYQGQDLGGRIGIIVNISNYIYAEIDGFDGPIKFFRSELQKEEDSPSLLDGEAISEYLDKLWADDPSDDSQDTDDDDDDQNGSNSP